MTYIVDFVNISTVGLETSPVAAAQGPEAYANQQG